MTRCCCVFCVCLCICVLVGAYVCLLVYVGFTSNAEKQDSNGELCFIAFDPVALVFSQKKCRHLNHTSPRFHTSTVDVLKLKCE